MKLIKFYTQTCGPCKALKPIVDEFISNHPELEYQEIDCSTGVPDDFALTVKKVPTIIVIKQDKPNASRSGYMTYSQLEELIA